MADKPLTLLDADAGPSIDDIVYVVNDPAGVKEPKKVTLGDILILFQNQYHKAKMYRNVAQSIPDETLTKVLLDTQEWDVGAIANPATGTVTIVQDGQYCVHAHWEAIGLDSSEYAFVMIYKNAAPVRTGNTYYGRVFDTDKGGAHAEVIAILDLLATNTIEMYVWHDEDAAISTGTTEEERPSMAIWQIA